MNGLANGWSATVRNDFANWPSADFKSLQGAVSALNGGRDLEMYSEIVQPFTAWLGGGEGDWDDGFQGATGWRLDEETGEMFGRFPRRAAQYSHRLSSWLRDRTTGGAGGLRAAYSGSVSGCPGQQHIAEINPWRQQRDVEGYQHGAAVVAEGAVVAGAVSRLCEGDFSVDSRSGEPSRTPTASAIRSQSPARLAGPTTYGNGAILCPSRHSSINGSQSNVSKSPPTPAAGRPHFHYIADQCSLCRLPGQIGGDSRYARRDIVVDHHLFTTTDLDSDLPGGIHLGDRFTDGTIYYLVKGILKSANAQVRAEVLYQIDCERRLS